MTDKVCMCCICAFEYPFLNCDFEICSICENIILSGCYELCYNCSNKDEKCYQCGEAINFDEHELSLKLYILNNIKDMYIKSCRYFADEYDYAKDYGDRYMLFHDALLARRRNFA
jgi:hypothetical protein